MKKQKSQLGFAHLIIITVILGLGLIGALGFVYYQNFIQKKDGVAKIDDSAKTPTDTGKETSDDPKTLVEYKTYTTDKYNISFQYPSTWPISETKGKDDDTFYQRYVDIKNASGEVIAKFEIGMQLGGTCDSPSTVNTIEAETTKYISETYTNSGVKTNKNASFSFSLIDNGDNTLGAHYGLTDSYTTLGASDLVCRNTFYYNISPAIDGVIGLGFSNSAIETKKFSNIDDAKKYMNGDEYKEIKKMILTLKY